MSKRSARAVVVVFFKAPDPGKTKMRLSAEVGVENAANLSRAMLYDLAEMCRTVSYQIVPFVASDPIRTTVPWSEYRLQSGSDIGERMSIALHQVLDGNRASALLVGSDIPGITSNILDEAFRSLEEHDLCLGPTYDGGFYLIGGRRDTLRSELFQNVPWSSGRELFTLLSRACCLGLRTHPLSRLSDIDTLDDVRRSLENESLRATAPRYYRNADTLLQSAPDSRR